MIRILTKDERLPMDLLLLADPSEKHVKSYCSRGTVFVLEKENTIIGEYVLLPTHQGVVELMNIAVDEKFQSDGYGKQLVEHAAITAKAQGYTTLEVGTASLGLIELMFYQKCGFRMTSIDQDFFVRNYEEPININGLQLKDMVRLSMILQFNIHTLK